METVLRLPGITRRAGLDNLPFRASRVVDWIVDLIPDLA